MSTPARGEAAFATTSPEPPAPAEVSDDERHPMKRKPKKKRRVTLELDEPMCMTLDRIALDAKEGGVADASKAAFARVLLGRFVEDPELRDQVLKELRRTSSR